MATQREEFRKSVLAACGSIGDLLRQEYRLERGRWWLWSMGRPVRELTADEVEWHRARKHAPFVEGGVEKGDPRWWDEPR